MRANGARFTLVRRNRLSAEGYRTACAPGWRLCFASGGGLGRFAHGAGQDVVSAWHVAPADKLAAPVECQSGWLVQQVMAAGARRNRSSASLHHVQVCTFDAQFCTDIHPAKDPNRYGCAHPRSATQVGPRHGLESKKRPDPKHRCSFSESCFRSYTGATLLCILAQVAHHCGPPFPPRLRAPSRAPQNSHGCPLRGPALPQPSHFFLEAYVCTSADSCLGHDTETRRGDTSRRH